mmetsp:Transcript_96994/g.145329  ORF Transcript_96994/g.145329 Transcript_96994/m.145329 type:complete len:220 (-) Transcript_96994:217-876(-)
MLGRVGNTHQLGSDAFQPDTCLGGYFRESRPLGADDFDQSLQIGSKIIILLCVCGCCCRRVASSSKRFSSRDFFSSHLSFLVFVWFLLHHLHDSIGHLQFAFQVGHLYPIFGDFAVERTVRQYQGIHGTFQRWIIFSTTICFFFLWVDRGAVVTIQSNHGHVGCSPKVTFLAKRSDEERGGCFFFVRRHVSRRRIRDSRFHGLLLSCGRLGRSILYCAP